MILLISAVFPPEPVVSASLVNDLALALSEKWRIRVLTPKPSRPLGFSFGKVIPVNDKFEHIVLNSYIYPKSRIFGRMLESYSFGKHAAKYIEKNRSEIQCIYLNVWPLLAQYLVVKTSKKYSIPSVTHIMDIYPETLLKKLPFFKGLFHRLLFPIDKYIQQNSSIIVTISLNMKNMLIETREVNKQKVKMVHIWQNEERFLNYKKSIKKKQKNSSFTFMFLGSLSSTAAINVLISAFKGSGLKNSRLVIAGNGPEKEHLISLADRCEGLTIEFWDAPLQEVPEIQDIADVLLVSLKKGAAQYALPSKLPAYMFSAKPVIACVDEESDTARIIKEADCGWIVPPENFDALTKIMKKVVYIDDKELLRLGTNGFNYAVENFSKEKNLDKLVKNITEIATKHNRSE